MDQVLIVAAEASSVTYAQRIFGSVENSRTRVSMPSGVGGQDMGENLGF